MDKRTLSASFKAAAKKAQQRDLNLAQEFAERNPDFDYGDFLEQLESQMCNQSYLTVEQHSKLKRLIDAWHMKEWAKETGVAW